MTSISLPGRASRITTSVSQDFDDFRNAVSASFVPLNVTCDHADSSFTIAIVISHRAGPPVPF
ncbi:MAG: hypothetical protein J2P19_28295 [Pseudonocardia sp.]|nr:hypothetical protein [Pseudonocardia sp.]